MNQDFTYGRNFADFLGSFWSSVFDNGALGSAIGYASSENMVQMYMDMVDVINSSSIYTVPVFSRKNIYPVRLKKSEFVNYSEYPEFDSGGYFGAQPDGTKYKPGTYLAYGKSASLSSSYFYPISSSNVSSLGAFAVNRLFEPSVTLCNSSDFMQTPDGIIFRNNPFDNSLFPSRQILDTTTGEIDQEIVIWFCDVDEEAFRLHKQFGYTFTNYKTSSEQYKKIIQTVFELVSNGPSLFRLDAFISAIAGSPLIREAYEIVESVADTPEGKIIVTDLNVYQVSGDLDLRQEIVVGAKLKGGAPILDVVQVIDTMQDKWWESFEAIPVKANTFSGIDGFLSFPNQTSLVTYIIRPDTGDESYRGISFPLIGEPGTVEQFWKNAVDNSIALGASYGAALLSKYGPPGATAYDFLDGMPFSVNPARVFAEDMAKGTIFAIKVKIADISDLDRFFKTINVLAPSCPVHLRLMLFLELTGNVDVHSLASGQSVVAQTSLTSLVSGAIGISDAAWDASYTAEAVSAQGASYASSIFTGAYEGSHGEVLEKIDLSSASVLVQNIELKQVPKCIA